MELRYFFCLGILMLVYTQCDGQFMTYTPKPTYWYNKTKTTSPPWYTTRTFSPSYQNCYIFNTCLNGGSCLYNPGNYTYRCACPDGYNGTRCEKYNTLTSTTVAPTVSDSKGIGIRCGSTKICYNNATCNRYRYSYSSMYSYSCRCTKDYIGTECDTKRCNSKTDPCLNGGRCSYNGRCYCRSSSWYSGSRCQIVKECNPHVYSLKCKNRGYCYLGKCNCSLAYDGHFCENYRNCSSSHHCLNSGTCHNGVCYCKYGYSGRFCDMPVYTTTPSPCQCKFGNCMPDPRNGYQPRCFCDNGYTGRNCETEIKGVTDEGKWCKPVNPCHNKAKCIGDDFDYDCKCSSTKYYGSHCERQYVTCSYGSSCQNGGTCKRYRYGNLYKYVFHGICVCRPGFKGDFCEKEIDSYPHWMQLFGETNRWSGDYSYNKFLIPFQLNIDTVNIGKGVVMATFTDQDTKIIMKGYSLDDMYITFNLSKFIKPSHRIPTDIEITGQFLKHTKNNIWEYKGKVSRPDNAIFGTFSVKPSEEKAKYDKHVALAVGLGTTIPLVLIVAIVVLVIIAIRKGILHREPAEFRPTRFTNSDQSIKT